MFLMIESPTLKWVGNGGWPAPTAINRAEGCTPMRPANFAPQLHQRVLPIDDLIAPRPE
jgi:hypothetical protein